MPNRKAVSPMSAAGNTRPSCCHEASEEKFSRLPIPRTRRNDKFLVRFPLSCFQFCSARLSFHHVGMVCEEAPSDTLSGSHLLSTLLNNLKTPSTVHHLHRHPTAPFPSLHFLISFSIIPLPRFFSHSLASVDFFSFSSSHF